MEYSKESDGGQRHLDPCAKDGGVSHMTLRSLAA